MQHKVALLQFEYAWEVQVCVALSSSGIGVPSLCGDLLRGTEFRVPVRGFDGHAILRSLSPRGIAPAYRRRSDFVQIEDDSLRAAECGTDGMNSCVARRSRQGLRAGDPE